jgi:NADPH:quinone reductase-like Zn-dependent oxidoreductase
MLTYSADVKAYEIPQFGIDSLTLTERDSPEPGPGQVKIRMKAWSLNYRDLLVIEGRYNPRLKMPMVPFSDGCGEVVAAGEGVTRCVPGDRVAGIFMQSWLGGPYADAYGKSALGGAIPGVLAEEVVLPETGVVHLPAHLTWEQGATLPCAAVTAWDALVSTGGLKAGETVLVLGSGGVSIFALQFATALGARVIATTGTREKESRLRELGAAEVVNYRDNPDWEKKVRDWAGPAGIDHVVEVGGAGTFAKSLQVVRGGGSVYVIGNLTGLTAEINVAMILHKFVRVQGIFVGSREMFEAMNQMIASRHPTPVVDRVFGFEDVRSALRHLESGAQFGKVAVSAP